MVVISGCSFKFELTAQRTALENQILGSYKELDSDVVLVSSVRSLDATGTKKDVQISDLQLAAVKARQNQDFNRDDIDELKDGQILGETNDGRLALLPAGRGLGAAAKPEDRKLAEVLLFEENRDRQVIWQRVIQQNQELGAQNLKDVIKEFVKMQRQAAKPGHWYEDDRNQWQQKVVAEAS